ncbi:stemmadenine O-acetyltransferase-like [Euphorbia lathyris]|uniref:stemmadenine O-acetyltransferase-like n=1 Tax=Euphorbia lathyris TaxID=212925 RepID=UPI0033132E83
MAMKVEIISKEIIKPYSPTPDHAKDFKICMLDELAPPSYVPILLFYPPPADFTSDNLKKSLSETLVRFHPLAGKLKGNISFDCNGEGVLFVEAKVNIAASEIINNPQTEMLHQLFPLDPYKPTEETETTITGVQVNVFACGSVAIGVCVSHKIADAASLSYFLQAWAATTTGIDQTLAPRLDSAVLFPPRGLNLIKPSDLIRNEKVVTRRFIFERKNLANLKSKIGNGNGNVNVNPTRVEAVTVLIWKSAMEVVRVNSGKNTLPSSIITHQVNFRERMNPPLPGNSLGNLCRLAVAAYIDVNKEMELQELVGILRKSIRKIDGDYLEKLQGVDGLAKAIEPLRELRQLASGGEGAEVFTFSSWTRFPLYEIDFGWGKPIRACTLTVPVRNCVILMATRSGDGIEAWITLNENDMVKFESSEELLQFVSAST